MARTGRPPVTRVEIVCAACGTTMLRRKTEVQSNLSGKFFCNSDCRRKVGAKRHTGEYRACEQCGDYVYFPRHALDKWRFCSKTCYDTWQARNAVTLTCEFCNGTVRLSRSLVEGSGGRSYRRQFCSKTCEGMAKIKRPLDWNHNGKPGRLDEDGYVWIWEPEHPASSSYRGWLQQHRLVAEAMIGRRLTSEDEVNHINRIKHDNTPSNLEVLDGLTHAKVTARQRKSDRVLLLDYIARYGPLNGEEVSS